MPLNFPASLLSLALFLPAQAAPVKGFADVHVHMFSEYAFGGAWLHGTVEGEIALALSSCEVHFDPFQTSGSHAEIKIPFISSLIGKTPGSKGDTGTHSDHTEGYPSFSGWPRWDTIAHQQVWEGHLKSAHEQGLNLLVVSLVNFEPLCELMPEKNKKYQDCSDPAALDRQLDAVERFEKNHDWFKIVRSPEEARSAIHQGKLAVVLSIEESHLFGDAPWKPQFERAWSRGVRTLQIAHQLDNRFSGVAIHHPAFRLFDWYLDFKKNGKWWQILTPWKFGIQYKVDPNGLTKLNQKGLTDEGRELITEMMNRGMPLDLSHLSEVAVREIKALTDQKSHYPVYLSHGHLRSIMDDGKFSVYEKSSAAWVIDYVKESGGVFGLRTGPEKTKGFSGSRVPNDCQGSSKSFAQAYQYGESLGLQIAFGSDLNGFIQQTRPRFGNGDETCGAETDRNLRTSQQKAQQGKLNTRFDQSGFGDISQIADLLKELKNYGINTQGLENSAEAYLKMWERAVEKSKSSLAPL